MCTYCVHGIYSSPTLFPTKNPMLNQKVFRLNNLIHLLGRKHPRLHVLNNNNFASENGTLDVTLGRYTSNSVPNVDDIVHLGSRGIRLFAHLIKSFIISKGTINGIERKFKGTYKGAVTRNLHSISDKNGLYN